MHFNHRAIIAVWDKLVILHSANFCSSSITVQPVTFHVSRPLSPETWTRSSTSLGWCWWLDEFKGRTMEVYRYHSAINVPKEGLLQWASYLQRVIENSEKDWIIVSSNSQLHNCNPLDERQRKSKSNFIWLSLTMIMFYHTKFASSILSMVLFKLVCHKNK